MPITRTKRCWKHRFNCSHVNYSPGCGGTCIACGAEHSPPVQVTLPGELSPSVSWLPAPEPDPTYARRLREGAMGQHVPWVEPAPVTVRRLPTRGYSVEVVAPEPVADLRFVFDCYWFGGVDIPSDADDDSLDGYVIDNDPTPMPRCPTLTSIGLDKDSIAQWRRIRAGFLPPHLSRDGGKRPHPRAG